ncbi:CHASE2 domain-containing protein [Bradyrhizobium sp. SYSU BS000235]|uniref:CHASE2 domain-containing protein n=1 Tax=Bradyrhizobium sp. SYSU BS000235 TaxID=3411332 RepID=UPI003C70EAF7
MSRRTLQTLTALVLAGLWGAGLSFIHVRGDAWFLDRIEATMTDLRTVVRGKIPAPDLVTIVAIDDEVVREQGGYPLPRAALAKIIDRIARFDPKVIVVDLLFVDPGSEAGDRALEQSLGQTASVIAGAAVFGEGKQWISGDKERPLAGVPSADRFLLPLQRFSDHAAVGVVNVATDRSGTPRFVPMFFRAGDRVEASLPLRVATLAAAADPGIEANRLTLAGRSIRTDVSHVLPLTFYGPRGTIRTVSAAAVLNDQLASDVVRDRIVVIGATVTGGGDVFPTPFDSVLPGVEVVSTAISQIMTGDGIVRDRSVRLVDAGIAVGLPMLIVGLLAWRRSALGLITIAAAVLFWCVVNFVAFSRGIWMSAALPMAAAIPPAVLFGGVQIWQDRRRAQYFATKSDLLQQFQAPIVREWLTLHPDFLAEPRQQNAGVVFIDLSGFTALTETLAPNDTRELLKSFHALIDREAVASGGVITSFMGDGAMILFGLPEPKAEDAANAVRCCVDLCHGTEKWLASLPSSTAARIGFKVGAHFGTIVASRLGGGSYQHITATGDTVNVASRLMEVAAKRGVELALSDDLLRAAGPDNALLVSGSLSDPVQTDIRGRSGLLTIHFWDSDNLPGCEIG